MRYTGLAARVRMIRWAKKLIKRFREMGIEILMIFIYVDDVRIVGRMIKQGVRFCDKCEKLYMSTTEDTLTDEELSETMTARTARLMGLIMNKIEPGLRFTTEYKIWIEDVATPPHTKTTQPRVELVRMWIWLDTIVIRQTHCDLENDNVGSALYQDVIWITYSDMSYTNIYFVLLEPSHLV